MTGVKKIAYFYTERENAKWLIWWDKKDCLKLAS